MTRNEMIDKLVRMAIAITGDNTSAGSWDATMEMWDLCSDWNREHEEEEIFMCEYQTEDSEYANGIMIEDDYFIFEA